MKRRMGSAVLALVMLISMFSFFSLSSSAAVATDVTNLKANDSITVGKYDAVKDTYTLGQIKVVEKTVLDTNGKSVSYFVLDSTTFVANEESVPDKTKSALKLIEQAVNEVFVERKSAISYSRFGNVDSMSAPYSLTISPYAVPKLEERGISSKDYIWLAVGNKAGKVQSVYTNVVKAEKSTIKYAISDELYAKGIRFANSDSQTVTTTLEEDTYNVDSFVDLVDANGKSASGFYWKNGSAALGLTMADDQETETALTVDQPVSAVDKNKSVIKDMTFKAGTNLEFVADSFNINEPEDGYKFIEVAKYDVTKDSYTAGLIKIIKKDTLDTKRKPVSYYVLDSNSFVANNDEVLQKTKNDLKLIEQAVNEVFVERKNYISYSPFGNVDSKSAPYSLTISPYAVPKLEQKGMDPSDYIWLAVGNKAGKVLTVYTNVVEANIPESTITFTISDELYANGVRFYDTDSQSKGVTLTDETFRVTAFAAMRDKNGNNLKGVVWYNKNEATGYKSVANKKYDRVLSGGEIVSKLDEKNIDKSIIYDTYFYAGTNLEFVALDNDGYDDYVVYANSAFKLNSAAAKVDGNVYVANGDVTLYNADKKVDINGSITMNVASSVIGKYDVAGGYKLFDDTYFNAPKVTVPEFPVINGAVELVSTDSVCSVDTHFSTLDVKGAFVIDTTEKPVTIVVDNLITRGNSTIRINGGNPAYIYIRSASSSFLTSINADNDYRLCNIVADCNISLYNVKVNATVTTSKNFSVVKGSSYTGKLFSTGTLVTFADTSLTQVVNSYIVAPNASVNINNHTVFTGRIVANSVGVAGTSQVLYGELN